MKRIISIALILISLVFSLTACPGGINPQVDRTREFESHEQFLEFINKYSSQNDGFVETFVSFVFDDHDAVKPYRYYLHTNQHIKKHWITGEIISDEIYANNHLNGFVGEMFFYDDTIFAQIMCEYITSRTENYYQNDEVSIEFVKSYHENGFLDDKVSYDDFYEVRTFDVENAKYENRYNYLYLYQIKVNGENKISVKITTKCELSQEKLTELCNVLMDSIVIINMEK